MQNTNHKKIQRRLTKICAFHLLDAIVTDIIETSVTGGISGNLVKLYEKLIEFENICAIRRTNYEKFKYDLENRRNLTKIRKMELETDEKIAKMQLEQKKKIAKMELDHKEKMAKLELKMKLESDERIRRYELELKNKIV